MMRRAVSPIGTAPVRRERLTLRGAVQGVGFRPFVYREACALRLAGWVANTPNGVTLEIEGTRRDVAAFKHRLRTRLPPNASVSELASEALTARGERGFAIRDSVLAGRRTARILPDLATCDDCLRELFDPADRRHRYPFINCTQCGPRFSIVEDLPYDRARTTMRRFAMCPACRAEYENPEDRRFHAEPNACPACGPQLALWDGDGRAMAAREAALTGALAALRRGGIVAVKGLGGFHLMVDARAEAAVQRLRARKRRPDKPFAVMFPSPAALREICTVTEREGALLAAAERPIVLVRRHHGGLAPGVAPRNPHVGALLPYTPLHHLIVADLGFPVVATSGNLSDEPIVADETEAVRRLAGIADLFLVHDRPIVRPVDDSVVHVVAGRPQILRRARGYAPAPVVETDAPAGILALGGHLKTTVALTSGAGVVLSPHIGDLDSGEARDAHARIRRDLSRLHAAAPRVVVRDLHPDYHTSRVADGLGLPVVAVQHHVAHVAAAMAEHGLAGPVLGVAFDGTGYGPDGSVWGGEFLLVGGGGWRRVAYLRPFRLPGGEAAVREPRRSAFGLLAAAFGEGVLSRTGLAPIAEFSPAERATLFAMVQRGLNAPDTSSAGRLFDAVAAIIGLRQRASYEGQAAAELEWAIGDGAGQDGYAFGLATADAPWVVDWEPALRAILGDLEQGVDPGRISARFHAGLAGTIAAVALRVGERRVALTGGCFQNRRLTEATIAALRAGGLEPCWHERVPPNDGGLAFGQVVWAARMLERSEAACA
jgi:hydrogenase maturation protein HypF